MIRRRGCATNFKVELCPSVEADKSRVRVNGETSRLKDRLEFGGVIRSFGIAALSPKSGVSLGTAAALSLQVAPAAAQDRVLKRFLTPPTPRVAPATRATRPSSGRCMESLTMRGPHPPGGVPHSRRSAERGWRLEDGQPATRTTHFAIAATDDEEGTSALGLDEALAADVVGA